MMSSARFKASGPIGFLQSASLWAASLWVVVVMFAVHAFSHAGAYRNSTLGPFCFEHDGHLQCKPRAMLCGCSSGGCKNGIGIDWQILKSLNYTGGIVRMATFKKIMPVPTCRCPIRLPGTAPVLSSTWLVKFLGAKVEPLKLDGSMKCTPCMQVPTHAWKSSCLTAIVI